MDISATSDELYAGKCKSFHSRNVDGSIVMQYRDDITAFDGKKKTQLEGKGRFNNQFSAYIMEHLQKKGIATHFIRLLSPEESLVYELEMLPVECVVRNITAGSICKRLGLKEGQSLTSPLFEFFLKSDPLGDPMITEDHILSFGWATKEQIKTMRALSLKINIILCELFNQGNMTLVDYKLEFGVRQGELVLGDEFTPDSCRLWDKSKMVEGATDEDKIMDKDRFRKGMDNVIESYQEVARRLEIPIE